MDTSFRINEHGRVCCSNPDPALRCPECQEHAAQSVTYPPDPYAAPLKAMRTAAARSASPFEEQWKAGRRRELQAEYERAQS